ncbi:MAG TPA: tail fiber protein [Pseudolabrys sp.]|nr:tail fiber protein [Pseudolabrys sp.]
MSTPYVAQISMFGGNFAPRTWAFCNGQLMSIAQNQALFSLLGTTYGGDGIQTFALPNMISRLSVQFGTGPGLSTYQLGQTGGTTDVTITTATMPSHNHNLNAAKVNAATADITTTSLPAQPTAGSPATFYASGSGLTTHNMATGTVLMSGQGQPHNNMMPSLCVSFIIALQGIFPSRN